MKMTRRKNTVEKGLVMQESVGQPINRVEGRDKVLGRAKYAADHTIPGLTYAVLVQSEVPHGVLKASELAESIKEVSKAPGVLYVLTPENCPSVKVLPKDLTYDLPLERRPPLSALTIQHVGQHLALIGADTLENATHAASLIELKCEQLPALLSAEEVVAAPVEPDAKDGQIRHGSYLPDHFVKLTEEKLQDVRGSIVDSAAQTRISQKYETPVHSHYPIELSSTIALWEGDSLTLYDSTRWIVGERKAIASYLDMPEDKVRIISPFVGGAFGSKSFLWMHVVLAAVAARLVGRPVKLVLTRDQMFTSTGHRPRTTQELVLVADHSGL